MLKVLLSYGVGEGIAKGLNISLILILPLLVEIESYAVIALMIILEQVLLSIFLLGQNTSTLRFYSRFEKYENTFLKSIRQSVDKISFIFVSFTVIGLSAIYLYNPKNDYLVYILTVTSLPLLLRMELFLTYLRVKSNVSQYLAIRIVYQVIKVTLAIFFALNAFEQFSYSASVLLSVLFMCVYIHVKSTSALMKSKPKKTLSRSLLCFGLPLALQATLNLAYTVIDRYMLSFLLDKESVSVYSFSYTIATSVLFLANIFVITYLPNVYKEREDLQVSVNVLKQMIKRILLAMLTISLVIYFFIYPLVIQFYDTEYSNGREVVGLLQFSLIFHVGYLFCLYKITLVKKPTILPKIAFFTLFFNILLNYVLIPEYGITGAAVATIICEFLLFILMYYFSNKAMIIFLEKSKK